MAWKTSHCVAPGPVNGPDRDDGQWPSHAALLLLMHMHGDLVLDSTDRRLPGTTGVRLQVSRRGTAKLHNHALQALIRAEY